MTIRPLLEPHGHTSEFLTARLVDPSDLAGYLMSVTSTSSWHDAHHLFTDGPLTSGPPRRVVESCLLWLMRRSSLRPQKAHLAAFTIIAGVLI